MVGIFITMAAGLLVSWIAYRFGYENGSVDGWNKGWIDRENEIDTIGYYRTPRC